MQESKHQTDDKDAALDDIVALAEKAALTIENLRAENTALLKEMRECRGTTVSRTSETERLNQRIQELEQAVIALQPDADRYRWMQHKYVDSLFLHHIEQEYRSDHPDSKTDTQPANPVILVSKSPTSG